MRPMSQTGRVTRASPVQTARRVRQSGADPKPPQAAAVKRRGGERCGNPGTMIPAGKVERGERKTADEVSKGD
jgi:hypothetical protein